MKKFCRSVLTMLIGLPVLFALLRCSPEENASQEVAEDIPWIPFEWVGDTMGGRFFDKLAINLPFSIEGIPHRFSSQFDLGATSTMVYGNAFAPYLEAFPGVAARLDTANKNSQIQGQPVGALKGVTFSLGDVVFSDQELLYFDGFGDTLTVDSVASASVKHVGTVGPDLFQNKVLLIDFPNQRIASVDSLPANYQNDATLVDMKLDQGRIKLPFSIDGTVYDFMFDTGSSLFPLMVTSEDWDQLGDLSAAIDTIEISSWGEYYDVYGAPIDVPVTLGDYRLPEGSVYANPKDVFQQFFSEENIMGITGNAYFLGAVIVIDYRNKRFGVVEDM